MGENAAGRCGGALSAQGSAAPDGVAGGRTLTAVMLSQHARTNAAVIERFLPVSFDFEERPGATLCTVSAPA
jgi:RNA 3'-terminal phosphate cyclase (ATP)